MEKQERLTVYLTAELLTKLKLYRLPEEFWNGLVTKALEREVRHRQGLAAHYRIVARREQISEHTGTQPASINSIYQLSEGSGRTGNRHIASQTSY